MVITFKADDDVINQVAKNIPTKDVEGVGVAIASFPTRNGGKPLNWYDWFRTVRAIRKQQKFVLARDAS